MILTREIETNFNTMITGVMLILLLVGAMLSIVKPSPNRSSSFTGILEAQRRMVHLQSVNVWIAPMEKSHRFGL
mgnify:CR=1 FL=1